MMSVGLVIPLFLAAQELFMSILVAVTSAFCGGDKPYLLLHRQFFHVSVLITICWNAPLDILYRPNWMS